MTAKKAFPQKSFPATVTFRPDQEPAVRALQAQRKLSEVCQRAVDEETKRSEDTKMETKKIEAETAKKMSENELMDAVWEAPDNSILEIFAVDPDSRAGDNDGVYLEIIRLDDVESVVRDRWPNQDGDRHIVSTSDIYSIYRALVDQVEEVA